MQTYKISPSDLTFLLNDCDRCFCNKVTGTWQRPYMPFPSVFNKIDKCMKEHYHFLGASVVSPDLPKGVIDTTSRKIESAPIVIGEEVAIVLVGKMDARINFTDGSVGVIDFKTSDTKAEMVDLYKRQLHAYAAILSNPSTGLPVEISHLGLVCLSPQRMVVSENDTTAIEMGRTWKAIALDWDWWDKFLKIKILQALTNPLDNPKCPYCAMRRGFKQ